MAERASGLAEPHIRLFKHFGPEKDFSTAQELDFLEVDAGYFTRVTRTDCRKNARRDSRGYYLCCRSNNRDLLIFSKKPEILTEQFRRVRGIHKGQRETLIELVEVMVKEGCSDIDIVLRNWLWNYQMAQDNEVRELKLEQLSKETREKKEQTDKERAALQIGSPA